MIYLDSAATTFQKPAAVERAVSRAFQRLSSPGRGGYAAAVAAAETALDCRTELQQLFHAAGPDRVVFTMNATHALNIAIKSAVPKGGRAVISGYEHNAVTRPLTSLNASVTVASGPLFRPERVLEAFDRATRSGADAVICNHVSNVFGFSQPVEEIAALCLDRHIPLIIDASQSAGVLPLDVTALGAAYVAMPGHKGLYGPQGTGVLLCGADADPKPLMEGGTGSLSRQQEMPDFLPDRLEAGTHNMPGIAGLLEGVRFVRRQDVRDICRKERQLAALAAVELRRMPGVRAFAQEDLHAQTGVLSFVSDRMDAMALGAALAERDVAVRSGLHCAPLAHQTAGTIETGTVRVSFSAFNTEEEVFRFLETLADILQGKS